MKTKNFNKKLALKKTTVTHLDDNDLNKVKGGWTELTCLTICRTVCVTGCPRCPTELCY